jgi:hypothetical protein
MSGPSIGLAVLQPADGAVVSPGQQVSAAGRGDVPPGFPFGLDEALAAVGDITALRSHRRHRVMTIGGLVAPQAGEGG